jgi:hypothetical protein
MKEIMASNDKTPAAKTASAPAAAAKSTDNAQTAASTASTPAADGAAASGETPAQAAERKRAPAANFLPIVRGRLPLIYVFAVRFDDTLKAMGNKDLAAKLGTSVGKVFDIKKGRNFAYVGAGFKPTAEDVSAAKAWAEQVGTKNAKGVGATGDKDLMLKIVADAEKRGLATAAEAAAFSAERTASRPSKAPAAGGVATGNSLPGAAANKPQTGGASAEALLG